MLFSTLLAAGASASSAFADPVAETWHRGPESCGTPQVIGFASPDYEAGAGGQRVIYVNRFGGHFTVSSTNAINNTVSTNILQANVSQFDIAAMETSWDWGTIRTCLDDYFKPFNVRIVESRPRTGNYVQSIVGGTGAEIGFSPQSGILGITSTDNFCFVAETGVTLSFSKNHVGIPRATEELCGTIAHETGHALSLEHEILTPDLMSYVPLQTSGTKAFVNQESTCGTDAQSTNPCSCQTTSAGKTNSALRLNNNVGVRPSDGTAPTLTVKTPGSDGKVAPAFNVVADATDASGMADVLVFLDNVEVGNDEQGSGSTWTIPVSTTEGQHTLLVRARDLAGNVTDKTINITAMKAALGEDCTSNASCSSNMCASAGGTSFCTQTCDPANATSCPSGFSCDATAKVCSPADNGGGCCSTGDSRGGATAMLFGLGVGAVMLRRRRR